MPQSEISPSQNWDINSQISQSKDINKQNQKEFDTYKAKTEAYTRIDKALKDYEAQGIDTSIYRKKLSEKVPDLSFGDKLGVVGRNIEQDYVKSAAKMFGGNPELTHSQKMDNLKLDREKEINPISTIAADVALDPGTYVPVPFAKGATKLETLGKNTAVGGVASGGIYTARNAGDENFKTTDSLIAAGFGGALNGLIATALGKTVPKSTKQAISKKAVKESEPIADEALQDNFIDNSSSKVDDSIVNKMMKNKADAEIQPKKESIFGFDKNSTVKDESNPNFELVDKQLEGSTLDSSNPSFKLGHSGSAETSPNMDYKSGSIASNTESIAKDITKNQDSSSRIINSSSSQTFGGGAVGGLESEATQRDYNNDGKHDYKDNLMGILVGAVGINTAKKLMPKAFKDDNIDKNTVKMFIGKTPKDTTRVSNQGKYKIPLSSEIKDMSNIDANELSFKEFNNPDAKHKEQAITKSAHLKRLIDKALGKPTVYADGTSDNTRLISSKIRGKDNIIVADQNSGNIVSGFSTSKPKYIKNVIKKDEGVPPTTLSSHQGTTVPFNNAHNTVPHPNNESIITKPIPKSQDTKLYSSPTIAGGGVGALTGSTSDLDGDGKITAKDIAIGALAGAGGTKLAIKATDNIHGASALTKLKKIANTDFVDAFTGHKIYAKKDYMNVRERMISSKNAKMEDFVQLHEQLKLLSDDARSNLHKYISGDSNVNLSPSLKTFADDYTNQIKRQGQELVNLGVLDQAQYDKFKGKYLHRVYEKDLTKSVSQAFKKGKTIPGVHTRGHEWTGTKTEYEKLLQDGKLGDFFSGKIEARKLDNGQYKFTQDWTKEQRARWGEIEDVAYTLPETLMRMSEMAEHGKMLKNVVEETKQVSNEALDGYVRLQGERYGALNGKYVPKDISYDIKEFSDALFGAEGEGFSREVKEAYGALSTFWKKSHTVYNPTAHVNNLLSNVTMQYMNGINPAKAIINAKRGAMAHRKLGEFRTLTAKTLVGLTEEETNKLKALTLDDDLNLYIQAEKAGLFGRSKLNDILGQYVSPTADKKFLGKWTIPKSLKKIDEVSSKWYQGEDDIMRFSMLKSLVDDGKSFDTALKEVNNTIPDYTKPMSLAARMGRKTMFTPFISWTYYSTPIILRQFKERPGRAIALMGALYGINKAMGIDPYDNKDIPQQNFSMKRIPIYKDGKEVTTLKVDRWMPHNDILSPHDFVGNLINGGAWKGLYETWNNQNLYYGGKITYKDGSRKAYDITKYGIQQITPDAVDKIWNLTESALLNKNKRKKHPVIQPRSFSQELLNIAGLNTLTYDKQAQKKKAIAERLK